MACENWTNDMRRRFYGGHARFAARHRRAVSSGRAAASARWNNSTLKASRGRSGKPRCCDASLMMDSGRLPRSTRLDRTKMIMYGLKGLDDHAKAETSGTRPSRLTSQDLARLRNQVSVEQKTDGVKMRWRRCGRIEKPSRRRRSEFGHRRAGVRSRVVLPVRYFR